VSREEDRNRMVERQIAGRGIRDERILAAFRKVPRHEFVPPGEERFACEDAPVPIGDGQTISQPYMTALMLRALELAGGEKVLEVGSGSGYVAALLSELGADVIGIERIARLARESAARLARLGCGRVRIVEGDGSAGLPAEAPFDRILVSCAAPRAPAPLADQLAPGGLLVVPVGDRYAQTLLRLRRTPAGPRIENLGPCTFVPLLGEHGFSAGEAWA